MPRKNYRPRRKSTASTRSPYEKATPTRNTAAMALSLVERGLATPTILDVAAFPKPWKADR